MDLLKAWNLESIVPYIFVSRRWILGIENSYTAIQFHIC